MFLLRVSLPDRPGSLGAVASALGQVGGDINAVEIIEKLDGVVIDDFIVALPAGQLPETMVTACNQLPGVQVEWISRYPEGGNLHSDLEALERMMADPEHAAETLVSLCPVVFRSHWASLLQLTRDGVQQAYATTLAPDATTDLADRLAPYDTTHRVVLEPGWHPGWGEATIVVTPLTGDRAITIGRMGGPPFLDSELARLHHLAALIK